MPFQLKVGIYERGLVDRMMGLSAGSFSRFGIYRIVADGQTDKHRVTVKTLSAYCIASRGKNQFQQSETQVNLPMCAMPNGIATVMPRSTVATTAITTRGQAVAEEPRVSGTLHYRLSK